MKVAVYTLGCKLNQCESEALATSFESQGFFIVSPQENADIYIVNTCTVTSKAEQKARRMIRKLSKEQPEAVIIVTGCYAQLNKKQLALGHNVFVVTNDTKSLLKELPIYLNNSENIFKMPQKVSTFLKNENSLEKSRFWFDSVNFNYHTRAFLKIQDGCDNSCAYCRVTIARGDSVSLNPESVIQQYVSLHKKGYKEVVLTGINIASYYSNKTDFYSLLSKLIDVSLKLDKAPRIRLSSIEPEAITESLVDIIKNEQICPHFHIPVQSGSDKILSKMNRRNDRSQITNAVDILREKRVNAFFAADVIAGFPGETEKDFELTKKLLIENNFSYFHVFPFSPRPGTLAEKMKPKVPERISGIRTKILREYSAINYKKYLNAQVGKQLEVLFESKEGKYIKGTSENYLKCILNNTEAKIGDLQRVIVKQVEDQVLICDNF